MVIEGRVFLDNQLTDATIYNADIVFGNRVFDDNQDPSNKLTFHGYSASTTKTYADVNGFTFKALDPVVPVDKSDLKVKLIEIDDAGLTEADYNYTSWSTLQNALSAAEDVLADEDATQDDIDTSLGTLNAYKGLGDPEDLEDPTDPTDAENDSGIYVSIDDNGKPGFETAAEADANKLPMTATSFYTLIFGGLLLTIFGIATFTIFRARNRNH